MGSIQETSDQEYQDRITAIVREHRQAACFRTNEKPYDVSGTSIDFATFMARYDRKGGKR